MDLKLRWEILLIGLILVAAFGLRMYKLGKNELWLDEAYCTLTAKKGPVGIVQELRTDNTPPLYYLLLYLWMKVAGEDEVALRSLSVAWGVAAVFLIYCLGRKNFSPKVGLWAGLILAISPLHIYYSQETRMYAPLVFFLILFFHFLLRLLWESRASNWAGLIISGILALYTSYAAFFFLPVASVFFVLRPKRKEQIKMLVSLLIIGAFFLPWVPILLSQPSAQATTWLGAYWEKGKWLMLPRSFEAIFLGANYPPYLRSLPHGTAKLLRIATLIPVGLIFCSSVFPWRKERTGSERKGILFLLLAALFLPLVLAFLLSFWRPMFVVGRHDLIVVPVAALLLGMGLAKLGRFWALGLTCLVIYFTWATLKTNYGSRPEFYEKAAAVYILQNSRAEDAVVFTGYRRAPLEYYLGLFGELRGARLRYYSFPPSVARHLGWYDKAGLLQEEEKLKSDARRLAHLVLEEISPGSKVWIAQSKQRDIRERINRYFAGEMQRLAQEEAFEELRDLNYPDLGLRCFQRLERESGTRNSSLR